jgi:tetratricopeptide (TPR) repeat protein
MITAIRYIVVVLHELAHAIPAMWLTKNSVTVYLGSYGNEEKSYRVSIGKLEIWFDFRMMWKNGLCRPAAKDIKAKHIIVYTFLGPVVPFLIGATLFALALAFNFDVNATVFSFLFFVIGLIDLIQNLLPNPKPVKLDNGNVAYNDGQNIRNCLEHLKYGPDYHEAIAQYHLANYKAAAEAFNRLPEKTRKKRRVSELLIASELLARDFDNALKNLMRLHEKRRATPNDYCNIGYVWCELGDYKKGEQYFHKAIRINQGNKYALADLGYLAINRNDFEKAIVWANQSIASDDRYSHAYSCRGLARIKLGQMQSGIEDLEKSIALDAKSPYGYRNLGIYHLEQKNKVEATENFMKAKELNPYTHQIDALLAQAEAI